MNLNPPIVQYYILKVQPEQPIVPVPVQIETIAKEFTCPICHECFQLEEELKDHLKVHEEKDKYIIISDSEESCNEVDPLKLEPTQTTTENEYDLLEITKEEDFVPSEQYDQHNTTDNFSDESYGDYDKARHFCPVCKKGFPSKATLQNHIITHKEKLKYINKFKNINKTIPCPNCKALFATDRDMKIHFRKHAPKKNLRCRSCNLYFGSKESLKRHQVVHFNKLKCKICDKVFTYAKRLLIHEENHSKEKPRTKCTVCEEMILDEYFPTHIQLHDGEKPFPCKFCGKTFLHMSNLKVHLTIHTKKQPFKCKICGRRFAVRGNLSTHLRWSLCKVKRKIVKEPKEELKKDDIQKQVKKEEMDEEVFDCKSCGKKCNSSKGLKIHFTKTHKDNV